MASEKLQDGDGPISGPTPSKGPERLPEAFYGPWRPPTHFYLVCEHWGGTMMVFAQPLFSSFGEVLEGLMDGDFEGREQGTVEVMEVGDGFDPENASLAFAQAWWKRISRGFVLGVDELPPFVAQHHKEVRVLHEAAKAASKEPN